jgi:hypothetical protein
MTVSVIHGDARALPLGDCSVDAVCTDPPYELGFMGKRWDSTGVAYDPATWREALRVLKPGGHLLAFGGTRTYHRLACAVEDAGFEVRDSITWIYGSGFPKGSRVNRDERFCQCDASARTSSHTSPAPVLDVHIRTVDDVRPTEDAPQSGRRGSGTAQGFPADCHPERDCGGGPLHPEPVVDRSATPSPGCVPARTRSVEPVDARVDGSSRSPSLARRSGPPSSLDSAPVGHSQSDGSPRTLVNTSPADASESALRTPGNLQGFPSLHGAGFPLCTVCDKPNANGWNVALKPASEPIIVARKPLTGTVAANVLEHGTGAINVDGCRVAGKLGGDPNRFSKTDGGSFNAFSQSQPVVRSEGRWPANVVLSHAPTCVDTCADGCPVAELDGQSGVTRSHVPASGETTRGRPGLFGFGEQGRVQAFGDTGGASRFFPTFRYQAKAPTRERPKVDGVAHPTVKPLALMRWLVRLVTPPGGIVLDPFAGSGATGEAAQLEGFDAVLIERDATYLPLIAARLGRQL